jgi:hypothetical protein
MITCHHCNKEVSHEDEKGYEVSINRWTMDFPRVREYFHFHEDWDAKFKAEYISIPSSMGGLFGDFVEPKKETPAEVS